jgi:hypothetical protein
MKTFLLSIFALALVSVPVFGEDEQNQPKPPKRTPPAQRPVNPAPRTIAPRVQNNFRPQFQPRNNPAVVPRTYTPPRSYTPDAQARLRNNRQNFTPNQDMPRATNRTNNNVVATQMPTTNVAPNSTGRNRDWQNRNNNSNATRNWQNRNWQNSSNRNGTFTFEQARQHQRRDRHDRSWWRSRYNRIVLFGGGYYYWDNNYWYPAYGYDSGYSNYAYDEPIYGYDDLAPGQVIANVQAALQEQGYYNDAVDGLLGPATRAALSNFQRDQELPITAAIDGPTLQALGLN